PAGVAPMASIVVMRLPTAAETGVMQERVGCPLIWIVQAPHRPIPQPNFVPVMFNTSRSVHSSVMSGGTSSLRGLLLMVRVMTSVPPTTCSPAGPEYARESRREIATACEFHPELAVCETGGTIKPEGGRPGYWSMVSVHRARAWNRT